MKREMLNKILHKFNRRIVKYFPRSSVAFAHTYFQQQPIEVIEIGTYKGENALSILNELNVEKIYLIDPYKNYSEYKDINHAEEKARRILKIYDNRTVWIKKNSDEAVSEFKEGSVDFIYIDGEHSYKQVKKDMENYHSILKEGGILAGHDITSYRGVIQAVIEFCYEYGYIPHITTDDWYIIKEKQP